MTNEHDLDEFGARKAKPRSSAFGSASKRDYGTGGIYYSNTEERWIACIVLVDGRRKRRKRMLYRDAQGALSDLLVEFADQLPDRYERARSNPDFMVFKPIRRRPGIGARRRWEVLERDGHRCTYCGAGPEQERLVVDHIVPLASGGTDELDNLTTACWTCNQGKGAAPLRVVESA